MSNVILDERTLQDAVDYFSKQEAFVFDVEAQGDNREVPHLADLSWISLATKGTAIVVPFGHPIGDNIIGETKVEAVYGPKAAKAGQTYFKKVPVYDDPPRQMEPGTVFEILEPLFMNPNIIKAGHDVVYDLTASAKYFGKVPPGPYGDTKIAYWLLDENRLRYGLKEMVEGVYGHKYDYENVGKCVESFPFSTVAYYSYCDAKFDWLLYNDLVRKIQEQELTQIYDIEMDLLNVMVGMRLVGAKIDVPALLELQTELDKQAVTTEAAIYTAAGKRFNVNSNQQKQEILYKEQKLRPWKLTAGGLKKKDAGLTVTTKDYSVDDDVLASYPDNPVAIALREYGDIQKLKSTYVDAWLGTGEEHGLIYDEHIYAGFQQYGTVTGRFSCRKPNLQNIPRPYTELGKKIRSVFIPELGHLLVVGDYGQIELVVLAHYVGEGKLYEAFMTGIDPHTMTAAMVLGKDPADVTKVERQDLGKTLGFAVVYGAGPKKVASMANLTEQGAKAVLRKHEEMFPEIHGFKEAVLEYARTREPVPYIQTILGRKRRVAALNSNVPKLRMGAERQMFNSLIQGGAADLIKMSMIRLDSKLPSHSDIILTVHDEIVVSAPVDNAMEVRDIMEEAMTGEGIQRLIGVPLKSDIKVVDRWADAK